jgi:hypothetical protein
MVEPLWVVGNERCKVSGVTDSVTLPTRLSWTLCTLRAWFNELGETHA